MIAYPLQKLVQISDNRCIVFNDQDFHRGVLWDHMERSNGKTTTNFASSVRATFSLPPASGTRHSQHAYVAFHYDRLGRIWKRSACKRPDLASKRGIPDRRSLPALSHCTVDLNVCV